MRVAPGKYFETFAPLAAALEQLGWRRGVDMHAHLYDWRRPPSEWVRRGGALDQLREQVEDAVRASGRPAIAISFSMGGPYLALFLRHHVTPAWAKRHIAGHVALSASWAGSLLAPLGAVTGGADGRPGPHRLRDLLRALPVLAWLSPAPEVFGDKVLVRDEATGERYTAGQLGAWLRASGATQAADAWQANRRFMEGGPPPNVTLYCLYGTGIDTAVGVTVHPPGYAPGGQRYQLRFGDGDGTVPLQSLQACDSWQRQAAAPVHVRRCHGTRHGGLLREGEAFLAVLEAVLELNAAAVSAVEAASAQRTS